MKQNFIVGICLALIASCSPQKQEQTQVSTIDIDEDMQTAVDSILQRGVNEFEATSGQAIVMDVQSGVVKAFVGSDSVSQESGLVRLVTLLSALETKSVSLSDTVDLNHGILEIDGHTLHDNNWRSGGYETLDVKRAFAFSSNIAGYKIAKKAFKDARTFAEALAKYGYHVKDTSMVYNPLGYGIITTPMQNLQFVNGIAQGTIADKAITDSMKTFLEFYVTDGLGKHAASDKTRVAGASATTRLGDERYAAEFCGFFPVEKPKYSIIVCINKQGLPVSGGAMAGKVFREITEHLVLTNKGK